VNKLLQVCKKTYFRNKAIGWEKGFTMLEVLIGLIILSVGLLGLAAMQITFLRGNSFSIKMTEATSIARNKIEDFANTPFANITSGNDVGPIVGSTGINYNRTWVVMDVDNDGDGDIDWKVVDVTTNWNDPTLHRVSLSTVVSRW
jgi:type IV pilus assembly protein PilV